MAYEANAETARRLIAKFGRSTGVIRRPSSDNTVVDGEPWKATDADSGTDPIVVQNVEHVVFDAAVMADDIDVAEEASSVGFIAAKHLSNVAPKIGDIFETKTKRFVVVQVDDLSPGDLSLLYTLHLKAS